MSARRAAGALLAGGLAGMALAALAADNNADFDQLQQLMAQRQHREADYSEKKYLSMVSHPLQSSGQLIYDAPDHLEQRSLKPKPQALVLDHGVVTMQAGRRRRVLRLEDYPQIAPLIDSMRAILAGDRAALERVFALQFTGTLEHWQLQLTPRDSQLAASVKRIDMQGERDAVREVEVLQSDGDRSVMSITPRP
ncbi:MAG: LolA-related protein [Steroidobacteraceae bacterium]